MPRGGGFSPAFLLRYGRIWVEEWVLTMANLLGGCAAPLVRWILTRVGASLAWNHTLNQYLLDLGFRTTPADPCFYHYQE